MATTVVPPTAAEPSISDLRSFLDTSPAPVVTVEETVVDVSPTGEVTKEAEPEVQTESRTRDENGRFVRAEVSEAIQDPAAPVEKEEPLDPGVQKRIAKEVAKQVRIDREIAEAVSATKAKEAELAKLKATDDKPGSEPAPNTASSATEGKPAKPRWEGEGKGKYPTPEEYYKAMGEYETKNEAWLLDKAEKIAEEKFVQREHQQRLAAKIEAGKTKHGDGFDGMRQQVLDATPEGLQVEIGLSENWPDTVAHLAQHPDEMKALTALFEKNTSAAIKELGRLEDRLAKPAPKEPSQAEKVLPTPPSRVGGGATASQRIDLNKAPQSVFNREIGRIVGLRYN